ADAGAIADSRRSRECIGIERAVDAVEQRSARCRIGPGALRAFKPGEVTKYAAGAAVRHRQRRSRLRHGHRGYLPFGGCRSQRGRSTLESGDGVNQAQYAAMRAVEIVGAARLLLVCLIVGKETEF